VVMSNLDHERFPTELEPVVALLKSQRAEADPVQLDQIKQRALARATNPNRRFGFVKTRMATIFTILGLFGGTGGALAVAHGSDGGGHGHGGASGAEYRPGEGCGDKNHTHTGPPGHESSSYSSYSDGHGHSHGGDGNGGGDHCE
jgi:hypothetical protein